MDRVALAEQAQREMAEKDAEIARLRRTVCFFASVIKSGEDWSERCEEAFAQIKDQSND